MKTPTHQNDFQGPCPARSGIRTPHCQVLLQYLLLLLTPWAAYSQAVVVTATLDTNFVDVNQSTTLRIYAQVAPNFQANADRIFSWYVDVLNTNGIVATTDFDALVKASSDNDPSISGNGTDDGNHRRGIYDTFINLPGAGVGAPVELMSIPVTGNTAGTTRFEVRAGSGVEGLINDFIVAPSGGGDPILGGDYGGATVTLQVRACSLDLQISRGTGSGGPGEPLQLSFVSCEGYDHLVEFANVLSTPGTSTLWAPLPGAPHNSGMVTTTNTVANRFFRVSATPQ